ncbi:unnamed protein product [Schistocephalus solidus]|uniref:Retrotransposon gag protein n=1 Tax=Schistocephalus solidus TaxID=70667 RepID=A0A183SWT8_SCHSO|nr:unnamed protein product [Schistocephalus solidus]
MPWVALAAIKDRRQHAGESVMDFQRHLHVLKLQTYPNEPFAELEARILDNFVDEISLSKIRHQLLRNPPGSKGQGQGAQLIFESLVKILIFQD